MNLAIETIVFLGIGVIIAGIITVMISQWDIEEDARNLQGLMEENNTVNYDTKITRNEFLGAAKDFWNKCNHTKSNTIGRYYVYSKENNILTKEFMFEAYKELGWCKSIQSKNNSCGVREDVVMENITLPKVVRLNCSNSTLFIS